MKYVLLLLIRIYWKFKSKKRTKCIFKKSCSNYVYEKTKKEGFFIGMKALKFRIQNCRYGFELYENSRTKKMEMILPNKMILKQKDIAERLLK